MNQLEYDLELALVELEEDKTEHEKLIDAFKRINQKMDNVLLRRNRRKKNADS